MSEAEIKISYYRARYYDEAPGRFLSEDPVNFGANFYRYVKNNTLNRVDPFGLSPAAIGIPWWWWVADPVVIPVAGLGVVGAAIIIGVGELALAPATMDDAIPKAKPTPCEAKRKECGDQWVKDMAFCAAAYPDDPYMQ